MLDDKHEKPCRTNEVDVENVFANYNERAAWNRIDIDEAVFIRHGIKVEVSKEELDKFAYTGLSLTDFVVMREWDDKEA